jgi:uncharacterized protein YprB with RNaseH-like and TPR domain
MCFGARWNDSKRVTVKSTYRDGKEAMLQSLWEHLDQADAVVSWNGQSFDSRHANREFIEAGITPPSPYKEIDLMRTAKAKFKFPSNKLDYVAQTLGVGQKTPHTGFDLWKRCMAGEEAAWRLMEKYQKQDVNLLVDLYDKLRPWVALHPNRALIDNVQDGCPVCASTHLQKRGYAYTGSSTFQQYQCMDCKKWFRGSQRLATTTMR